MINYVSHKKAQNGQGNGEKRGANSKLLPRYPPLSPLEDLIQALAPITLYQEHRQVVDFRGRGLRLGVRQNFGAYFNSIFFNYPHFLGGYSTRNPLHHLSKTEETGP